MRFFPVAVFIAGFLTGCGDSQANEILITKNDLQSQCTVVENEWNGPKTVEETLLWLEEVMQRYSAEYAFQEPITDVEARYYYTYDGTSSSLGFNATKIYRRISGLHPSMPDTPGSKYRHKKEAKSLIDRFGHMAKVPVGLDPHKPVYAYVNLKPSDVQSLRTSPSFLDPPKYIEDILNEYETLKEGERGWHFSHSEWHEEFQYRYSRPLRKENGREEPLYVNYLVRFSAKRNEEGDLVDVWLDDVDCLYPASIANQELATLMPPATAPQKPIPPFYGASCRQYKDWYGCHKIKNDYYSRARSTQGQDFCDHVPPEEPTCEDKT